MLDEDVGANDGIALLDALSSSSCDPQPFSAPKELNAEEINKDALKAVNFVRLFIKNNPFFAL